MCIYKEIFNLIIVEFIHICNIKKFIFTIMITEFIQLHVQRNINVEKWL